MNKVDNIPNLNAILKNKGITKKDLADMLGISAAALHSYINGNPTIESLQKVANILDIPFYKLTDEQAVEEEPDSYVLKLKSLMVEKGVSNKQLADKIGMTSEYVSRLTNNKANPPLATLTTIAEGLGVHVSELFGKSKERGTYKCPYCGNELDVEISIK